MNELARDIRYAMDPVAWAEEVAAPAVVKGFTGRLDPWQADVIRSRVPNVIMCCTRQAGKSTIAALKAAHLAFYQPRRMVLVVSKKEEQAKNVFDSIERMIGVTEEVTGVTRGANREEDHKTGLRLKNGSRVVCAVGKEETIRSFSAVDLLIEDEAAFVPDEVNGAVTPMLRVSKGQMLMLSTPNGQRGHFWKAWTGSEEWDRYEITADKVSRIDPQDIERDRREKGDAFVRQEYFCEFVGEVDSVFNADQVRAALSDAVPVFGF